MNRPYHILMTGAGAPGAPGIISCLSADPLLRLTVADAEEEVVGKHLAPSFERIPRADAPGFIDRLLELCQKGNIDIVLPLVTRELLPLAEHKGRFEALGTKVVVSSAEAIKTANNKFLSYRFLHDRGLAIPRHFLVRTVEDFIHAAFELGHPQKPFCFKPTCSNGSRGVRIVVDSFNESGQLFNAKPYQLHITYTHALKILSSTPFPELLVSEYLPGEEFSVDCLAEHGKPRLVVPRLRAKMINGISVQGTVINDENIISYCSAIIEAMGLHGNVGIQVRYSEEGKPLLLEINPRVQGTIVAVAGAGVNLPLLAVHQEMGLPLAPEAMQVRWGTRFTRYWTEVFYEGC